MVAPLLIGAGIRAAGAVASGLAKKFGKKTAKEKAKEKAEREAKGKIQKEAIELDREVEEIGNKAYRSLYPKKDKLDGPTAAGGWYERHIEKWRSWAWHRRPCK
jgi:hypothetical protein